MSYGLVYLITNLVNGKVYVGQTTVSLKDRWSSHLSDWERNNYPLYHAFAKYGVKNFSMQLICIALDKEELDFLEILFIVVLRAQEEEFGYNIKDGGSHGQHVQSTKDKISRKNKGKPGHNKGGTCPAHVREAVRKANTGRIKTSKECAAISIRMKGRPCTWGDKISVILKEKGIKPPGGKKGMKMSFRSSKQLYKLSVHLIRFNVMRYGFYGS